MQMKQNPLQISRNQEKYHIKFIGDLNKMQCTGITCPQHKMLVWNFGRQVQNAIITYESVPKRMRRKGCQQQVEKRELLQTTYPRKRPKVTLRTIMGSCEIQCCKHASGKPRVMCRPGTLTPIPSGVAIGRKRKSNNLLTSESTASPMTKLTRASSTCREFQNKFKNLWPRNIFLRRLTEGQHSQFEGCEENSWSRQLRVTWSSAKDLQSAMSSVAIHT